MYTTAQSSDYQHILHIDIYPIEINWVQLINDIRDIGAISPNKQAEMLGKTQSTFCRWCNGSEPKFGHGHALLVLHQKICGPQLTLQRFKEMESNA